MSILATLVTEFSEGKALHEIGVLNFTGNYVLGGVALDFGIAGVRSNAIPYWLGVPTYRGYTFEYVPGTNAYDGKLKVYGSGNAAAAMDLVSDNTVVADGATVTVGTRVYTFKTTLTAPTTLNQIKIVTADADGTLTNLVNAINGAGTPGTDYGSLTTPNTQVSASAVTSHTTTLTALVSGTAGNAIAIAETSTHLAFTGGAVFLAGGVNTSAVGTELSAAAFPTDLQSFSVPFLGIFPQFV